jgi:alpha,alpha-trehalase
MRPRFLNLEDYGLIGNQETCALVGSNGSVDWLPLPYIDSPSVLAGILDPGRGGVFSVTPILKFQSIQKYLENTNVIVTDFTTATGEVRVTDFMPPLEAVRQHRMLLRKIEAVRMEATLRVRFAPSFDYGRYQPKLSKDRGCIFASGGSTEILRLFLCGADLEIRDGEAIGTLSLREGDRVWLALVWGDEADPPRPDECEDLLDRTLDFWRTWSHNHDRSESVHQELCRDLAMRSGLALKLLLNPASGGIAAAPTLALPEAIGGLRNWDYRFAWIRDASFTAQALFHLGYGKEASAYRNWLLEILRQVGDLNELRPLYPLHASAKVEEGPVEGFCGYRMSAPVRVGNKAVQQTQLDIYGEFVNTVFETTRYGDAIEPQVWEAVKRICDFICENWSRKDRGMWEMRTDPKHYLHSKLMCWVGLDRAVKIAHREHLEAEVDQWLSSAEEIRGAILERGFSRRLNSFVQCLDEEELDATALLIPIHQFLPPDDPRVQSTIDAVWRGLSAGGGLIYRYRGDDGLAGKEGAFILCSYWLINALAVSRRIEEAEGVFRKMLEHVSPLGLLSEEVDPRDGRLIGNFPQAISHIGLINAALHLGIAKGRGHQGPPPQSEGERF